MPLNPGQLASAQLPITADDEASRWMAPRKWRGASREAFEEAPPPSSADPWRPGALVEMKALDKRHDGQEERDEELPDGWRHLPHTSDGHA